MFLLLVVLALPFEVLDASATGFTSHTIVRTTAPAGEVYHALVNEVGAWWDPAHTYSGDSKKLSLEAEGGGCFCESLADGGSVQHMEVVYAEPGKTLRMRGGLGPLQGMAVAGAMTCSLEKSGDITQITLTYTAGGYYPGGLQNVAGAVDGVRRVQLERLAAYVEKR